MEDPTTQDEHSKQIWEKHETLPEVSELPPTPPESADSASEPGSLSVENEFPLPPPSCEPIEVLEVDKKTPDFHVPRDPRLIRLTGVHPFNVEAPLSTLFNEGFLTSPELFYVRNHGGVPEVQAEDIPDWEFSVSGYFVAYTRTCYIPKLTIAYQTSREPVQPHPTPTDCRLLAGDLPNYACMRWEPTERAESGSKEQGIFLGRCRSFNGFVYWCPYGRRNKEGQTNKGCKVRLYGRWRSAGMLYLY